MLKADGQTLITVVSLFVALVTWGIRLESKVESSVKRFEEHLLFVDKQIVLIRKDVDRLQERQDVLFHVDDKQ